MGWGEGMLSLGVFVSLCKTLYLLWQHLEARPWSRLLHLAVFLHTGPVWGRWPASCSFLRSSSWSALPFHSSSECFSPQTSPSAFHLNTDGSRNELKRFIYGVGLKFSYKVGIWWECMLQQNCRRTQSDPRRALSVLQRRVPGPAWFCAWLLERGACFICASPPFCCWHQIPFGKRIARKSQGKQPACPVLHSRAVISKAAYAIKCGQIVQNNRRNISS